MKQRIYNPLRVPDDKTRILYAKAMQNFIQAV